MEKEFTRGVLEVTYEGYGFVIPLAKGGEDVFVPAHAIGNALHRDTVEVRVIEGRRGKKEGRIVKILGRGLTRLVGRYEIRGKSAIVITEAFRVRKQVIVPHAASSGARHNEMVVVRITKYPSDNRPIEGEVIERLGVRGSDQTEISILIAHHNLPGQFPEDVLSDAHRAVGSFKKGDVAGRRDITHLPFITIDGEDAKDFDDAVAAEGIGEGAVRVWVSIADVSYFVKDGSTLDREASKRATSVYFPGRCIPMLPEDLSTDICSLLPDEDRYCFTAEMVVGADGVTSKRAFYRSVIKSRYRMTYTEANEIVSGNKSAGISPEISRSLSALNCAAEYIRNQRRARGSIDFDLPEPQVILDLTGKPESIVKAERNAAHMLIEDLMIAANEAVAEFLMRKGYPCVYRVHDRPDPEKLIELKILLKYLGHNVKIGRDPTPDRMANVVRAVQGRPEERMINMMLLRSMAQAVYSTDNIGHFGLASACYCHFTSPIRRYPDLLVHRLLADAVGAEKYRHSRSINYLKKEAENSSKTERISMEAEREAHDLYAAIFMRDKIGEEYDGIICHAAKKGIFVELLDFFVEGLVDPADLSGDCYKFDQKKFSYVGGKTGRSFHIGDKIRVVVKDVSIEERRIYFEPA